MSASITGLLDANCDPSMNLLDSKVQHRYALEYEQSGTVAADTGKVLRVVKGATGVIRAMQALVWSAVATGGDRTVNVDLKKSTGGGAFATVLSATIQFTSASSLRAASAGVFSDTSLQAGDILQIVVTVAGAAGAQAVGLHVSVTVAETPA